MRKSWVKAKEWVPVDDVKFLDIAEGPHGDEMTFEYEGEEYTSLVIFGSRPG